MTSRKVSNVDAVTHPRTTAVDLPAHSRHRTFRQAQSDGAETLQHTVRQLRKDSGPEECAALCRRSASILDRRFAELQKRGAGIACAAGCNYCCHLPVAVFPHEAVALFHHLRSVLPRPLAEEVERRILKNADRIDRMTNDERSATKLACAFLVNGRCSVYSVRPSACASYHSLSKAHCETAHHNPRDSGAGRPTLVDFGAFGEAQVLAAGAAIAEAGLESSQAELHQAIRTILQDAGAVSRWRDGRSLTSPSIR